MSDKAKTEPENAELLESFAEEARRRCDVISAGLATATTDFETMRAEAHALRGTAGVVGLRRLAELAGPDGVRPRRSEEDRRRSAAAATTRSPTPPRRSPRAPPPRPRARKSRRTSAAPWRSCSAPEASWPADAARCPRRSLEWGRRGHPEEFRGRRIHCFHQAGRGAAAGPAARLPDLLLRLARAGRARARAGDPRLRLPRLRPQRQAARPRVHARLAGRPDRRAGARATAAARCTWWRTTWGPRWRPSCWRATSRAGWTSTLAGVVLFDGSVIIERASLTLGQKLLRSRGRPAARPPLLGPLLPLAARLGLLRRAPDERREEGAAQWALMRCNGGNRIADKLIGYTFERATHAERWHGAVRDWPGHLALDLGPARTRWPRPTSSTASATSARRPPSTSSPTSPTTPRSKTRRPSTARWPHALPAR